ncbi:DNA internalization-related competence protein ComEC/Rec2 [hydrothermal vent metagenome]|uniref:DNA internalization-related competence protein ComEC/Rec2 n=1 Tax=hydrothermal vent metagenome TaxID=652676 RepID=A0A3B0RW42_9ZZZZ
MDALPVPKQGSITLWGPWVFCFGIAFWFAPLKEPVIWLPPVALVFALIAFIWTHKVHPSAIRALFLWAMVLAFLIGMCVAEIRSYRKAAPVMPMGSKSWVVTGKLHRVDRERGHRARYLVRVNKIEGLEETNLPKFVRVGGLRGDAEIGSLVKFRATLEPPKPAILPGGFSFSRNAWFKQIGGTGFTWGHLKVIEPPSGMPAQLQLTRFRYQLAKSIRDKMPGSSGSVAAALITGDRSGIPEQLAQAYRDTGLGHLLAISGLHMSLVGGLTFMFASIVFAAIPAIGARMDARKPAAIAGLLVSFSYLMISGATAPTQRAFIMLALIFIAVLLGRRALSIRTISVAAFLVALISPEYVASPGFQMSFSASLALIAVYQYAGKWFSNRRNTNNIDGPIIRTLQKMSLFFMGILLTSLIAGIATAPFASWHFHKIAVYSLLGNLLAMPVFSIVVMPFLFMGFCLMPFGFEGPFFQVSGFGLDLIAKISMYISDLPGAVWGVATAPPITLLFEALALIFLCLNFARLKYLAAILIVASLLFRLQVAQPVLWLGQSGGALLVQTAQSKQMYSFGKPNKFALRQFNEAIGKPSQILPPLEKASQANCDQNGCSIQIKNRLLAIRTNNDDVETDCQLVDLLIVTHPLHSRQQPACATTKVLVLSKDKGSLFYLKGNSWISKKSLNQRIWDQPNQSQKQNR